MKIIIDSILAEKNKTRYWLSKQTDISPNNIAKLCNNKTKSISFEVIDKICSVLDCTPNDILENEKIL